MNFLRLYTTNSAKFVTSKPLLKSILPKKSFFNKELYELKADHSFSSLYSTIEKIYKNIGSSDQLDESIFPKWFTSTDVMNIRHCLEKHRKQYKRRNTNLFALENSLLQLAVDMENSDAKALFAYYQLINSKELSKEEVSKSQKQLQSLYQIDKNPLSMKLLGDLASKGQNNKIAIKFYNDFLEESTGSAIAGEVYGSLGEMHFKNANFEEAEDCFIKCIRYKNSSDSVKAYYYLGQLYTVSSPIKSKQCFELSASEGFVESLSLLGFLEMNYFGNYAKAEEWFKLGKELADLKCYVGYFDLQWEMKNYNKCLFTYKSIQDMAKNSESATAQLSAFKDSRKAKLDVVLQETSDYTPSKTDQTRWDV